MSVHLARLAGGNAAETEAGAGTGLGGTQAERLIFIEIWKKGRTYGKKENHDEASYMLCGGSHGRNGNPWERPAACQGGRRGQLHGHV